MGKPDDFDELKETVSDFTKSLFSITSDSVMDAKDLSIGWLFNEEDDSNLRQGIKRILNRNNEMWEFPSFYEKRDKGFGCNNANSFYFSNPFGLISYRSPPIRKYNECLDKQGLSIWDSNGYWRCLFPNSAVPTKLLNYKSENLPNEILTKEDFETEARRKNLSLDEKQFDFGTKGVYFKSFEDLMNWKSVMYNNMKLEKQKARDERRQLRSERHIKRYDKDVGSLTDQLPQPEKSVVSTNLETTYTSDQSKNETVFKEIKTQYFSDGTSKTHTITKIKPFGEDQWTEINSGSDSKKGWFWK